MNRTARLIALALLVGGSLAACASGVTPPPSPTAPSTPSTPSTPPPAASETPTAVEIGCDLGGHDDAYHIHSGVGIRIDGELYAPPADIGITDCMYWVHTHRTDGVVHVEAPADVSPTLGDFLDIWEGTYPDDELLATARAAVAEGKVTVDDQPYTGDALALPLADKLRIILGE